MAASRDPGWEGMRCCRVGRDGAEIPGQSCGFSDSDEKFTTRESQGTQRRGGGERGDRWCSDRLILQDMELISPPATQAIHSISRIITRLFCTK